MLDPHMPVQVTMGGDGPVSGLFFSSHSDRKVRATPLSESAVGDREALARLSHALKLQLLL